MIGRSPHSCPVSRAFTITQSGHGYTTLQQRLLSLGYPLDRILVVMEATGPYWINLATTLVAAGFPMSVINPYKAPHFAKSLLKRAKIDAVDAQTLARLTAALQPAAWTPRQQSTTSRCRGCEMTMACN